MRTNSIAFRVALYFAINRDEELTSGDVWLKFGTGDEAPQGMGSALRIAVKAGWISAKRGVSGGKRGNPGFIFSAGPKLLELVGSAV